MAVVKRIKTVFQLRRGTTEEWNLNKDIIPAAGEPCFDLDLGTLKIGDGVKTYEQLKVLGGATISDDGLTLIVEDLQADIAELQVLIGEDSVEDQIANAMADVAKASELETVVNNMTVLESKVTTSTDSVTEMQTIIEQNNAIVAELQTAIENKVDNAAVEALEVEMKTYVDEQIKSIETGDMDGGVIE